MEVGVLGLECNKARPGFFESKSEVFLVFLLPGAGCSRLGGLRNVDWCINLDVRHWDAQLTPRQLRGELRVGTCVCGGLGCVCVMGKGFLIKGKSPDRIRGIPVDGSAVNSHLANQSIRVSFLGSFST